MNFTAIDFETATGKRDSACALGLVRVENGVVKQEMSWLIRPPELRFNPINISIHGITPEDVYNQPHFGSIWEEIRPFLENRMVLAHNASFDVSVLRACMTTFGIPFPSMQYMCTVQVSRQVWPHLTNHKLNTLADYFKFSLKHHDALDDTRACARIALEACHAQHCSSIPDLAGRLHIYPGELYRTGYNSPKKIK